VDGNASASDQKKTTCSINEGSLKPGITSDIAAVLNSCTMTSFSRIALSCDCAPKYIGLHQKCMKPLNKNRMFISRTLRLWNPGFRGLCIKQPCHIDKGPSSSHGRRDLRRGSQNLSRLNNAKSLHLRGDMADAVLATRNHFTRPCLLSLIDPVKGLDATDVRDPL
jgi:hypothetical protein